MADKKAKLMLWKATETGKHDAVKKLLDKGIPVDEPLTDGELNGLHLACARGDLEIAKTFIKHGANIDGTDNVSRTPLHFAAANGENIDLIDELISKGANVDAQSIGGDTPLMKAIMFDNAEAVKALIDHNADISIKNENDRDAASFARASRNSKIMDYLGVS